MTENSITNHLRSDSQDNSGPDISPIRTRYKGSLKSDKNIVSENSSENKSLIKKNKSIRFTDDCM
jgi:hypothetical protein